MRRLFLAATFCMAACSQQAEALDESERVVPPAGADEVAPSPEEPEAPAAEASDPVETCRALVVADRCGPAHHFGYANNMAVRASLFEELGPFKTWKRAADSELVHRIASRRPDLQTAYHRSMRVTHMEFLRGRDRARRLGWGYTGR